MQPSSLPFYDILAWACAEIKIKSLEAGTKVGQDQLVLPVRVRSTWINSDRLGSSLIMKKKTIKLNEILKLLPFEGKIPVKNGPNQERLATFLHVMLCSQAAILYSKYQFLSQAPQAQNTWCMRQLCVY